MLGTLPTTLNVNGKEHRIRTDYRDVLNIIAAFNDTELSDREKVYVCMKQIFIDLNELPRSDYQEAYNAAIKFIDGKVIHEDRPGPKVINWEKDEPLLFAAINKVAGYEVRAVEYMHWWTFLGYFQEIDGNDTWGFILMLRQKKAKGKRLEKHEKEFWMANRNLCSLEFPEDRKTPEDLLREMYEQLAMEGGAE